MASSMADHLRAQEYSRLRRSTSAMLTEPPVSEEAATKLIEAYQRDDTSPQEYLALVTEQRAFTPAPATQAVLMDTGSYCTNMAVPVILKSFLQDHGNATVKEVLAGHGVAMLEKVPSGGVLIRLRSPEDEAKLVGEEVNLLGRKFKIKRQSLLMNKFFLDVSGIHSTDEANKLFMALCALGAPPLFLTPRDVNLETHVVTPTWRFYFGSDHAPPCLVVHNYVTHQLVYDRHFYAARGKQTTPPPARATAHRQSRYAVELPFGDGLERWLNSQSQGPSAKAPGNSSCARRTVVLDDEPHTSTKTTDNSLSRRTSSKELETPLDDDTEPPVLGEDTNMEQSETRDLPSPLVCEGEGETDWNDADDPNQDIDMSKHLETGFKRMEPSFADDNPFAVLDSNECNFEVVLPNPEVAPGVLILPHRVSDFENGPGPSKKRLSRKERRDQEDEAALEEALLLSEKEAQLMVEADHIAESTRHRNRVESLLKDSKNMDQIVVSMCSTPLAWTMSIFKDMVAGGEQILDLANIHLWNRVLAGEAMDDGTTRSFYQRMANLNLKLGNSRGQYSSYLSTVFDSLPSKEQNDWNLLRWLSIFELLALSSCPFIFEQPAWLHYLVENADNGLPHAHIRLFSDKTLLQLLRSAFGEKLLEVASMKSPGSTLIIGLEALRSSNLSFTDLPVLSTSLLASPLVDPSN
ncbi:hypothetical protein DVH05_007318 [Phytophthora capsici]|nr:hypothetical protein DVH05_007318 [Phytophthora capsici]